MSSLTYTAYELKRMVRNRRFFIFSLAFPLLLFLVVGGSNRGTDIAPGIPFVKYYMVGMAGWGATTAVLAGGTRIATERAAGWTRLLRAHAAHRPRVLPGEGADRLPDGAAQPRGALPGRHDPRGPASATDWLQMTGLVLVALVPMAALGILLGHLLNPDSMGPVLGGISALFALLGGAWFPPIGLWARSASTCRRTGSPRLGDSRSLARSGRPRRGSSSRSGRPWSAPSRSASTGSTSSDEAAGGEPAD